MAIDLKDFLNLPSQNDLAPSKVEYHTIELSVAWTQMLGHLDDLVKEKEALLQQATQTFQQSGDYSHAGLLKQKALLDITQGQLYILTQLQKKMRHYHQEEHYE